MFRVDIIAKTWVESYVVSRDRENSLREFDNPH
jgi:hypothetical protein